MIFNQESFLGGIEARYDDLRPEKTNYPLLINGRVRQNAVETIQAPLRDDALPDGIYQNITAIGSILIVIVSGEGWYRDTATTNSWRRISGLALDTTTYVVDTCDIPSSTIDYKRSGPIDDVKFNNSPARASAEGVLATDGITQPYLIYPILGNVIVARITQTYTQWTETAGGELREYVPVGRYPVFVGQKLYMAIKATSGYLNRIAQSVSGRPLDFVVAIDDATGNKAGDALTTAHAVGFDPITGLYKTSSEASFVVGTANNAIGVTPDYSNTTFFGEPALRNIPLFPVGIINNNSAVDLNGDSGFITPTGIHSFNAVLQVKVSSNNDPISIQIHNLLAPVQTFGATADFNDYAFFAVDTIFGPGVVVFDKTLRDGNSTGKFVSIDLYAGIGQIKQFARTSAPTGNRLFFITADNRLFEFGAADTRETCRYYIGEWNSSTGRIVQNFRRAFAVFSDIYDTTTVQVTQYADREQVSKAAYTLNPATRTSASIIPVPYRPSTGQANGIVQFESPDPRKSFAVGAMWEWNTDTKLVFSSLQTDDEEVTPTTLSQTILATSQPTVRRFALLGDTTPTTVFDSILRLPSDTVVIGLGDFFYGTVPADDWAEYSTTIARLISEGRWYAIAGNHDVDYDSGLVVRTKVTNGKRYESYVIGDAEFFFYNVGWSTATLGDDPPPFEPDGFNLTSVQATWLKASLAISTARFKFVCLHYPAYSSGNYYPGYTDLRLPFRAWGATAVFNAHDHSYQRHIVDGMNYITAGTGGRPLTAIVTNPLTSFQAGRALHGYVSLKLDAYNATTQHVGVDRTVFDQFIINT